MLFIIKNPLFIDKKNIKKSNHIKKINYLCSCFMKEYYYILYTEYHNIKYHLLINNYHYEKTSI